MSVTTREMSGRRETDILSKTEPQTRSPGRKPPAAWTTVPAKSSSGTPGRLQP